MENEGTIVTVEVDLPATLLSDIDEYAVRNGYENPSAVVREALRE
jgi:metal-responsive CopG/Arc/MetJ family transcriptional regulator